MSEGGTFSIKAVAFGVLIDIVGSMSVYLVGAIGIGVMWAAQGVKPQDIEAKAEKLTEDPVFLLSAAAVGTGFTMLGGYMAGRMAPTRPVLHGALVGLVGIVLSLPLILAFPDEMMKGPDWFNVGSFLVPIPAGAFGGFLASLHGPKPSAHDRDDTSRYYDVDDYERDRFA